MLGNEECRVAPSSGLFASGFGRRRPAPEAVGALAGLLFVLGLALVFWLAYYRAAFRGLFINDAHDYASIARNIALGRGVLSQYVTPLGLVHHGVPQPDLWRAPLWPLVLAGFQLLFGFTDRASALAGGACFIAAACLLFLLGRRWFNLPVALAASLLYLFSAQLLEFSISGLTEPLAVLLMLLWLYVLTAPGAVTRRRALLAGVAAGLFYLARYNAVLFLLPGMIYVVWRALKGGGSRRAQEVPSGLHVSRSFAAAELSAGMGSHRRPALASAALFLAGFLLAAGPWLVRNQVVAGSPFFSLQKYEPAMFTKTHPGYSLYMRPLRVDVPRFIMEHPEEVRDKFLGNFAGFRRHFLYRDFTGLALRVFACFLLALVLPLDRAFPAQQGVRPLVAACFGLQLAALLFLHYIPRLFMIFVPVYAIYAAGAVWFLGEKLSGLAAGMGRGRGGAGRRVEIPSQWWEFPVPGSRTASEEELTWPGRRRFPGGFPAAASAVALAAFTLLGAAANLPDFHPDFGPHPTALWGDALRDVKSLVPPDRVVISDNGQIFAWYGERYACKLPYSPELLPEVSRLAPVGALFLTNWITWAQPEADKAWAEVFRARPATLAGFRLAKVYPDGSLLYLRR
ncbi:MAG TPA: glycosyltransferase family 39 protein [Syntrophomonadaceae bacterium]|nr:glycosyltransferase family 39 protein [Syntrophomonadaceae bacterium]